MDAKKLKELKKRQALIAKRGTKALVAPYEGEKYRASKWAPFVYGTERGILDAYELSGERITNEHVRIALIQLVLRLRDGKRASLADDEPDVEFAPEREVDFIIWSVRDSWGRMLDEYGSIARDDLAGICRTLLYSIEAHGALSDGGYLGFLQRFLRGEGW